MIMVSFQCNNPDNGDPLGKLSAIHVHSGYGVDDLEFEGKHFPDPSNRFTRMNLPPDSPDRCDGGFKIGRHVFPCAGWTYWYGNWCWDATRMTGVDVLVLIRTLRDLGYRFVAGDMALGDAYDAGAEITPKLVQEALT